MRWSHPTRGSVAPAVFIPFAEQSGQIIEMGQWVLERAWRDRDNWQVQTADEISISVNVSTHQFMSAGFVDTVAAVLAVSTTDAGLLTLEVPEGVLVRDRERALIVLQELRALGVKLALDDFGTGYSSLSYLNKIPVDTIKVDQGFITNIAADPASSAILTAIIGLAHSLGMTVVAKGVETVDQQRTLSRLGSDFCQGFYFAPPMPAASVDALMAPDSGGGGSHLPSPHGRAPVTEAGLTAA
jgi:EAL domain-containing protein (putative c-di-GMP-specific phosphodiesterase class I)